MERFPDRIRKVKEGNQQQLGQSKGTGADQSHAPPIGSAAGQSSTAAGQVRTYSAGKGA